MILDYDLFWSNLNTLVRDAWDSEVERVHALLLHEAWRRRWLPEDSWFEPDIGGEG